MSRAALFLEEVRTRDAAALLEDFLERRKAWLLGIFSVFYFAGTALRASSKPFEHDELFTFFLSRLDFPSLWRALRAGADASPPLTDLLVKAAHAAFGEGPVATRLPAMMGFWLMCVCLFYFVRRRLGVMFAAAAMLLPFATGAYPYAYMARCYGQILGGAACALLCWQLAAESRRRKLALAGFALSLVVLNVSHYYGVLIYAPLAAGELWRTWERRKADFPVWGAMALGLIPLAACFPLISGVQKYAQHPWAFPRFTDSFDFYEQELVHLILPGLLFVVLTAIYMIFRDRGTPPAAPSAAAPAAPPTAPAREVIAILILTALPAIGLIAAYFVTHMFSDRYVISGAMGAVLLIVFAVARLSAASRIAASFLLAAGLAAFFVEMAHFHRFRSPIDSEPLLRQAVERGPVAIDDGLLFLPAWYYLPPELRSRVYYVDDPASAAAYAGADTIDLNFLPLNPAVGMPLVDYAQAAAPGRRILIYHNAARPVWLVTRLLHDGARVEAIAEEGSRSILNAEVPAR